MKQNMTRKLTIINNKKRIRMIPLNFSLEKMPLTIRHKLYEYSFLYEVVFCWIKYFDPIFCNRLYSGMSHIVLVFVLLHNR